jgi:N-acetylmuramate 1-kinase
MIAMDAPPPQEDCRPFVGIAQCCWHAGLNVPKILAQEIDLGFLLLSDLGDTTYLSVLKCGECTSVYTVMPRKR